MSAARRFGGELTEILANSMRPAAFVPGSVLVVVSGLIGYFGLEAGVPEVVVPLWMAVGTVALMRYALNATHGSFYGGLFDVSGGSWAEVFPRAARMAALNLTWAIPIGLVLRSMRDGETSVMGGPVLPSHFATLLLLAVAAIPPFVLVLSVATDRFADAISPATWSRVFGGRGRELLAIYAVFIGGVSATLLGALVVSWGLGGFDQKVFFFLLLVTTAWGMGVTHALLGRLVGGFLRTADGGAGFDSIVDDGPDDPFVPIDLESLGGDASIPAYEHVAADPEGERAVRMAEQDSLLGRLKANEHIEDDDVLLAHEDALLLEKQFGPHPQVLARIAVLARRAEQEDSVEAGRRAVEAALKVSNRGVLADLYEAFGDTLGDDVWPEEELVHMAGSLAARQRDDGALDLYGRALQRADAPLPIVKAMIQWADGLLRSETTAQTAVRVYDVLDAHQPDHPFAEFVERGRQVAERKLERIGS